MKRFPVLTLSCCALFLLRLFAESRAFFLVSTGNVPLASVEAGEYVVGTDCHKAKGKAIRVKN